MKKIFILSIGYPYGTSEPFLQDEVEYHKNVTIFSSYIGTDEVNPERWKTTKNFLIHPDTSFFKGNRLVLGLSALRTVFTSYFWREVISKDIRPLNIKKIVQLMSCISKANQIVSYFKKKNLCNQLGLDGIEPVFYAYWMNQLALAAVILAKKYNGIAVSRCHGYDLYKRAENNQYVTLQSYLTKELDYIYPISQNGKDTLCKLDVCSEEKIHVSRLGTKDFGLNPSTKDSKYFSIVSCSNVVPLKRVNMILEAIMLTKNINIKWVHFGTGPLLETLRKQVESMYGSEHDIQLKGYTNKTEIMKYYGKNHVDLFINVSESEGIPVSIMEALSFGIPCIGTDVGGMHEIINSNNGWLVNKNITPKELADLICTVTNLDYGKSQMYRKNARELWEGLYSADRNYTKFIEELTGYEL